jgi:hypothetical protein
MSYPTRSELRSALLELIDRRGGRMSLCCGDDSLEGQLADYFGMTEKQRRELRSRIPSKGQAQWRSELQGALRTLVREGSLDDSSRDQVELTSYGRRQLRSSVY